MRSVTPMRIAKIGYIVISVILCLLGTLLLLFPTVSVRVMGILCGITLVVFGAIKLVGYFSRDLFRLAFQNDLASGIVMLVLGLSLLLHTQNMLSAFCTVLGILILADGLFKIQIAMDAKPFGIRKWWLILLAAILTGVFGLLLLLRPSESLNALTVLLGVSLIWDGILNLSTMLTAVKIVRNQMPDEIVVDPIDDE